MAPPLHVDVCGKRAWLQPVTLGGSLYLWFSLSIAIAAHRTSPPLNAWQTWLLILGNHLPLVDTWHALLRWIRLAEPNLEAIPLILVTGIAVHQIATCHARPRPNNADIGCAAVPFNSQEINSDDYSTPVPPRT